MQFIINTGHPQLSFSACLLNIAQASLDLYDQIMAHRSLLLSFKTWHNHGEIKQLLECAHGSQLQDLNQQFDLSVDESVICTALITDSKYHEPVCLALFGMASHLEQYTSQFKRLQMCPSRFFIDNTHNNDDDDDDGDDDDDHRTHCAGSQSEASVKQ
jgi:peptidyl-tRNA hydrolase